MLENENLNEPQKQQLNIGAVSGSLPSDEEIRGGADEWVFDINGTKWSNNDAPLLVTTTVHLSLGLSGF